VVTGAHHAEVSLHNLLKLTIPGNQKANQLKSFFLFKLDELRSNKKQVKIMINNVDKIKEIGFLNDKISLKYGD